MFKRNLIPILVGALAVFVAVSLLLLTLLLRPATPEISETTSVHISGDRSVHPPDTNQTYTANSNSEGSNRAAPGLTSRAYTGDIIAVTPHPHPASIRVHGRLRAKNRLELFPEAQGQLLHGDHPLQEGVSFAKNDILYRIHDDELRLQLHATRSAFQTLAATILPDLRLDYPHDYPAFSEWYATLHPENPLTSPPETENQRLHQFLSARGIYDRYYQIQSMEHRLEKFTVRAPFTGTLSSVRADAAQRVGPQTHIGTFIDTGQFTLTISIGASLAEFATIGDTLWMQLPHGIVSASNTQKGFASPTNSSQIGQPAPVNDTAPATPTVNPATINSGKTPATNTLEPVTEPEPPSPTTNRNPNNIPAIITHINPAVDKNSQSVNAHLSLSHPSLREGHFLEGTYQTGSTSLLTEIPRLAITRNGYVYAVSDGVLIPIAVGVHHLTRETVLVSGIHHPVQIAADAADALAGQSIQRRFP
jgi:hypothetical protein